MQFLLTRKTLLVAALPVTLLSLRLGAEPQTRLAQAKAKQRVKVATPVTPATVEFEAASIHRTAPDVQLANLSTEGGEFRAQNVSVRRLIEYA